jgi:hypothetical protein
MQYKSKTMGEIIEAEQFCVGFVSDKFRSYTISNVGEALGINLREVCSKCGRPGWHHMYVNISPNNEETVGASMCEGDYLCFIDGGYPWVMSDKEFNEQYEPYGDSQSEPQQKPIPDPTDNYVYKELLEAIESASADAKITNLHVTINIPPEPKDEIQHGQCTKLSKADIEEQIRSMWHEGMRDPEINIDEAIKGYLPKNTHPLKNPDSSHYAMWHDGPSGEAVEAIDLMEKMATKEELLTWAKLTVLKYRLRIGKKDDIVKEMKKIETYEAYIVHLERQIKMELEERRTKAIGSVN